MVKKQIIRDIIECEYVNCRNKDKGTYNEYVNGSFKENKLIHYENEKISFHDKLVNYDSEFTGDMHEMCFNAYKNSIYTAKLREYDNKLTGKYCYFDNKELTNKELETSEMHDNKLWCKSCLQTYKTLPYFTYDMNKEKYDNINLNLQIQKRKEGYFQFYNALDNKEVVNDIVNILFENDNFKNKLKELIK